MTDRQPWKPQPDSDGNLSLEGAVGQALGSASMCWVDGTAGRIFDSAQANRVREGLMAWLRENVLGRLDELERLVAEMKKAQPESSVAGQYHSPLFVEMPADAIVSGSILMVSYLTDGGDSLGVGISVGDGLGTLEAMGLMEMAKVQYHKTKVQREDG